VNRLFVSTKTSTMSEPMSCCLPASEGTRGTYCQRCDLLVGLDGFHVVAVSVEGDRLMVDVETAPQVMGCRTCGVDAVSRGCRVHPLVDAPSFGRPVRVRWCKTDVVLTRTSLPGRRVPRARRACGETACAPEHTGVLVGDTTAEP
jgi:hypothetical protein